jgi:hypothetical protein
VLLDHDVPEENILIVSLLMAEIGKQDIIAWVLECSHSTPGQEFDNGLFWFSVSCCTVRACAHWARFTWRFTYSIVLGSVTSLTNFLFSIIVFTSEASLHVSPLALSHAKRVLTSSVGFHLACSLLVLL